MPKLTKERIDRLYNLAKGGLTSEEIAVRLGLHSDTVRKYCKQWDIAVPGVRQRNGQLDKVRDAVKEFLASGETTAIFTKDDFGYKRSEGITNKILQAFREMGVDDNAVEIHKNDKTIKVIRETVSTCEQMRIEESPQEEQGVVSEIRKIHSRLDTLEKAILLLHEDLLKIYKSWE